MTERALRLAQSVFAESLRNKASENDMHHVFAEGIASDRLAIYRGNIIANAGKALSLTYPVVVQVVGEEFFAALSYAYWVAHPSRSGDLNEYGEHFGVFLECFERTQNLPYLPDVARLEWLAWRAYGAADHVIAHTSLLASIPAEQLADTRWRMQAAAAVLESQWPIASIWQQHQGDWNADLSIDLERRQCALVYREGLRVRVAELAPAEHAFWQGALRGDCLNEMLARAFTIDEAFDVATVLQRGFERELIQGVLT